MSDLKLSLGINNMLITLKAQTIEAILSILKERKHANIELHKAIVYQTTVIDEGIIGFVETISKITILRDSGENVIIETDNYTCYPIELKKLPIEQLIDILIAIENNGYEWAADGDAIDYK
jgi:hypothetical protein